MEPRVRDLRSVEKHDCTATDRPFRTGSGGTNCPTGAPAGKGPASADDGEAWEEVFLGFVKPADGSSTP